VKAQPQPVEQVEAPLVEAAGLQAQAVVRVVARVAQQDSVAQRAVAHKPTSPALRINHDEGVKY